MTNIVKNLVLERDLPGVDGYKIQFTAKIEPALRGKHLGIAHVHLKAIKGFLNPIETRQTVTLSFYEAITEEFIENLWKGLALKIYSRSVIRIR